MLAYLPLPYASTAKLSSLSWVRAKLYKQHSLSYIQ